MNSFFLVTIEGRIWITNDLVLHSTGVYKYDITNLNFTNIFINGVAGSASGSIPTGSDTPYTYHWDEAGNLLYVRLDASDITDKVNFVITHLITLTNNKDLYFRIDPTNVNSRTVLYQGRLKGAPVFSQDQENNLVGILSTSLSSISLINDDQFFNMFGTYKNSFKNSTVRVFKCDDGLESANPYYVGYISRFSPGQSASFYVNDMLKRLENILYSKTNYENSITKSLTGDQYEQKESPIYKLVGRNSPFKLKSIFSIFSFPEQALIPESMPEAVCVDYNPTLAVNVNRTWSTGIVANASGSEESYEILTLDTSTYAPNFVVTLDADYKNFTSQDTFFVTAKGSSKVKAFVPGGLIIEQIISAPDLAVGDVMRLHKISALVLVAQGEEYLLYYGIHYTVSTITAGEPIEVVLIDDLEAALGLADPIDPARDNIYFKMRNVAGLSSYGHGTQIKNLLLTEFSSSDLDLDSFSDADTDLELNINYMIPAVGDGFPSKRDVLQRMLTTSMGYLYMNELFQIAYGNYTSSEDSDETETITDLEIEKGSIKHEIDFEDVYESLTIQNTDFGFSVKIRDEMSTYLHHGNKTKEINTYAEVVTPDVADLFTGHFKRITGFFTCPKIKSSISVLNLRSKIGEKKKIESLKSLSYPNATVVTTEDGNLSQEISLISLSDSPGKMYASANGNEEQAI